MAGEGPNKRSRFGSKRSMNERDVDQKAEKPERSRKVGGGTTEGTIIQLSWQVSGHRITNCPLGPTEGTQEDPPPPELSDVDDPWVLLHPPRSGWTGSKLVAAAPIDSPARRESFQMLLKCLLRFGVVGSARHWTTLL